MSSPERPSRRVALKGLGALAFVTATGTRWLTPAQARAAIVPYTVLTPAEVATLEALGETLMPGATRAGIAHFVDHQLVQPPADALLMLRYLDVPPPYAAFYQPGLAALDAHATRTHGHAFVALTPARQAALVPTFAFAQPPGWQGPPSPLLYLAVRADAVDVVHGTHDGLERLGLPTMEHILPERDW